jgi:imidazoleglycerol-phosphate dehydratase
MSRIERETNETRIVLDVRVGDGPGEAGPGAIGPGESRAGNLGPGQIDTGEPFLDHMLVTLARYAGLRLDVSAKGDLRHHLVEDVAISLGLALAAEVPARAERYGSALIPMDEALVQAAVDVGGRAFYRGRLPSALYEHFLQSFATNLGATLHVRVIRGRDRHHIVEAAVKATGIALRQALREGDRVFSTKGSVSLELTSSPPDPGAIAPPSGGG